MEIIEFFQFAERRAARGQPAQDRPMAQAAAGDRWAQLHTEGPNAERPRRESCQVLSPDAWEVDFWSDLQFRLAYPTHRLRSY